MNDVQEKLSALLDAANPELEKNTLEAVLTSFIQGKALGESLGLTQEQIDSLYTVALDFYNNNSYKEATGLFQILCLYDSFTARNFFGLGCCYKEQDNFQKALENYELAMYFDGLENLNYVFQAALCNLKLGDKETAKDLFLDVAVMDTKGNPEYVALAQQAQSLYAMLSSQESSAK